jgi:transposase
MVNEILKSDADPTIKEVLKQLLDSNKELLESNKKLQATIDRQSELIERQTEIIEKKDEELAALRRIAFGKKSEKMPPMNREVAKSRGKSKERTEADKKKTQEKRAANAKAKEKLPSEDVEHDVDEEGLVCPHCGGTKYGDLGSGEVSEEYEFVPSKFIKRRHIRKKKACICGNHIVTAPAPPRVSEGVKYGPGFHAQVVVSKLCDSIPLHRQAKQLKRMGVPMGSSTLCDIFHRSASLTAPLAGRIIEKLAENNYINGDETRLGMQDGSTAYVWNFSTDKYIGYVFSDSRSGETPKRILKESKGFLQVDQYSGYNAVTTPDKRVRVGCMAHMRRKFWESRKRAPKECKWMLDKILDLYIVEYDAAESGCLGTEKHLAMRKARSKPILDEMKEWLDERKDRWTPKSGMGKAVNYARNNWESLTRFLEDPKLKLDNNLSERMLRIIALGRKNFLFVGHRQAGENLAILQTLVATCENLGVNPQEYLADVLIRIQTHPASRIDELLPDKWKPPGDTD